MRPNLLILQMRKLRSKGIKLFASNHTNRVWQQFELKTEIWVSPFFHYVLSIFGHRERTDNILRHGSQVSPNSSTVKCSQRWWLKFPRKYWGRDELWASMPESLLAKTKLNWHLWFCRWFFWGSLAVVVVSTCWLHGSLKHFIIFLRVHLSRYEHHTKLSVF